MSPHLPNNQVNSWKIESATHSAGIIPANGHSYLSNYRVMNREDSEKLLKNLPEGTWLLRYSESDKNLVISYVDNKQIKHLRVQDEKSVNEYAQFLGENIENSNKKGPNFSQKTSPMSKSLEEHPLYYNKLSLQQSKQLLLNQPENTWLLRFSEGRNGFHIDYIKDGGVQSILVLNEKHMNYLTSSLGKNVKEIEHQSTTQHTDLRSHPSNRGEMNRDQAENLLSDASEGTWLLRFSTSQQKFVVSHMSQGKITHTIVENYKEFAHLKGSLEWQKPHIPSAEVNKHYGDATPILKQKATQSSPRRQKPVIPDVDRSKIYGQPINSPTSQVNKLSRMDQEQVNQWFNNLAALTAQAFETKGIKNSQAPGRFRNITSPHHTAFHTKVNGKIEYLHANYVRVQASPRQMLVTQAPTYGTEHLFWQAALEQGGKIVDLTNGHDNLATKKYDHEGHVIGEHPYRNYPTQIGVPEKFGNKTVTLQSSRPLSNGLQGKSETYIVKDNATGREHKVVRENYTGWPDYGAVSVQELDNLVNTFAPGNTGALVHCRAGVGRSGSFVMATFIKDAVASGKMTEQNVEQKLEEMIIEAREQRGESFVQAEEQLGLLKDYALLLLQRKAGMR